MEMVFRKIEYWIEGDSAQQRRLKNSPWNFEKIFKKVFKQIIFFIIAFLVANTFMAYLVGIDYTLEIISQSPLNHFSGFLGVIFFSGLFYFIFSYFREQACVIVCPYGRLQSVLLDPNSLVVAYDFVRGEPRGKINDNINQTKGDCIDCSLCVAVCPTGIDIRNGTQLECINCTACIDACDSIMEKINKPKGLIRYASLNGIKNKAKFKLTPRAKIYSLLLLLLISLLVLFFSIRTEVDASILRVQGKTFQLENDEKISNLYKLKVVNNTFDTVSINLEINNPDFEFSPKENIQKIIPQSVNELEFKILISKDKISKSVVPISINVYKNSDLLKNINTNFLAPIKQ